MFPNGKPTATAARQIAESSSSESTRSRDRCCAGALIPAHGLISSSPRSRDPLHHLTRTNLRPTDAPPASNLTKSREVINLLLERGALWRPEGRTIADLRKSLYHIDPEVITEITDRLRDHRACDEGVLHELLRTPKMLRRQAS